jgi:DNA-binding CsgD family transcriptional regulator
MDMPTAEVDARPPRLGRVRLAVGLVALQVVAALFFVVDSITDIELSPGAILADFSWLEVGIAVIMLASIALGARLTRRLMIEARDREQVIAMAQGAFAEVVAQRFGEWKLSAAETDVGMFALKGCSIAEIARLRGSAEGTVRAQLSQVYAKAGVTSQPMFVALFVEDLLG